MRPRSVETVQFLRALQQLPSGLPAVHYGSVPVGTSKRSDVAVTGVALDSRSVLPGDLYAALPGARRHGAEFAGLAVARGATAVLTDAAGASLIGAVELDGVPVFTAADPRVLVGPLSRLVFRSQPDGVERPALYGVTGTNGKTTTTYFLNSLLRALGRTTGLIGTIEILAGEDPVPSLLTTPESPQVHSLLALMRERKLTAASMEVSSHALEFGRVDGVVFDVAGFTNLTQDHLDLHGDMESYFAVKAQLFDAAHARARVITVDDGWGQRLAREAAHPVITLLTTDGHTDGHTDGQDAGHTVGHSDGAGGDGAAADWRVGGIGQDGLGHAFTLTGPHGVTLSLRCGLPGTFNISNAALAAVMVVASGVPVDEVQRAADSRDPFTIPVPGRMQVISDRPAGIVDFAHNPDALGRTLSSVRRDGSRVIVVFGATGQRDETKRPIMGAVAARSADVVIVTDDDPHDEDDAFIRAGVLAGAAAAVRDGSLPTEVLEVFPRAAAIEHAVKLAGPDDTIVVAGRGHEVWQEVKGVNLSLDDRVELAAALTRHGFSVLPQAGIES
ncbi:UDP-N-acetylmuramoyl-L-alanyl-D-glutamate--2,6-diaminopimelate ligase [Arthrobacter sp. H41]|uniref:UDP-N-acetylmuramoyl-L-alanyl-D-glutamate--2, 6-diaminopimelate ligase n=1 Tax=Arthrobacter sp. H41 TaxID=1312978 RepID=UPI0004AF3FE8|nr:UDP-N-acetylmuramoyl-L-alanyl-D-glutamate--2,6-diaminopimelate ligase [Arthrobacter sp. H41]